MPTVTRECRWCGRPQLVDLDTDGRGQLVEGPLPCGCADKRAARLCIECSAPVVGKSVRCEPCKAVPGRRWRAAHPDRVRRAQRRENAKRRRRRRTKMGGEAMRERDREYRRRNRDRINAHRRRRDLADRGKRKAEAARRYRERHPGRVREQTRRQNARPERQQAKRDYMHRFRTKYVGEGKAPRCRTCPNEVPWDGRGRPRLDCFACRPLDSRERRSPRIRGLAARQQVTAEPTRRSA